MPKVIRRLQISELSFVDDGANPGAHILIAKRKEQEMGDKTTTSATVSNAVSTAVPVADSELDTLRKRVQELENKKAEVPVEITKHIELQNQELTKLRDELEKSREVAFTSSLVAKYAFAKDSAVATAFYKLHKFDVTLYDEVIKVIDGALAQVADSSVITKELGNSVATRSGDSASSVTERAAAAATELVKAGKAASFGEALIQVYKTNSTIRGEV